MRRSWTLPATLLAFVVVAQAPGRAATAFGGGAPPPAPPGDRGVGSSVAAAVRYELGDAIFHVVADSRFIPENDVTCLAQDTAGFLWIGTPDGVVRYDGYTFRTFRREVENPRSLADNNIRVIRADSLGRVWIGTNGFGVSIFDPASETFTNLGASDTGLSSAAVRDLANAGDGAMWVATTGGLHRVDERTLRVLRVDPVPPGMARPTRANLGALLLDRGGDLWIGSADGLAVRRRDGRLEGVGGDPLSGKAVYRLFAALDGAIWIGVFGGGLVRLDPRTGDARLLDPAVRALGFAQVEPDTVWVGTLSDGIEVRDAATGAVTARHRNDPSVKESLASNRIACLRTDASGTLWIGTGGSGLSRYSPADAAFRLMRRSPARPEGLTNGEVESVFESSDGLLWVGTHDNGVDVFDRDRRVAGYRAGPGDGRSLDSPNVSSIAETADGAIWMGTFGAVNRLDRASGRIERIEARAFGNTTGRVTTILPVPDGSGLWVASTGGLGFLDPRTPSCSPARLEDGKALSGLVSDLAYARDGALWVAGAAGLAVLRNGEELFHPLTWQKGTDGTLLPGTPLDLLSDSKGRLWVGLSTGLARLSSFDGGIARFESLAPRLGVPNKRFDNLIEDLSGRIWVEDDLVFEPETFTKRVFGAEEGAGRSIWRGAAIRTRSGQLALGSSEGLFLIDPGAVRPWEFEPPVVLTDVRVDGTRLPAVSELVLPPGARSVSFEFASLDFSAPRRIRYAYCLRGFDPGFREVDAGHRSVSYTSLPPGRYTLEVRGSNREGSFAATALTLPIRVEPAWHQTTPFRLLAALLLAGLTWPVYRARLRLLERRQRELEGLVESRTAELRSSEQRSRDASEAKSVFLATMSHELRTPLNAVLGYAQLMRRSPSLSRSDQESLSIIRRSGEHLLSLIDQVLSISKIEAGRMTLEVKPFDLKELLLTIERMFQARAEEAGLELRVELDPALPAAVAGDAGKLRQALINLLGNAVKFTRAGRVTLRARWESGRLSFEVEDSGAGIAEGELASLFTPFVQTASGRAAKEGTGLGLAITRRIVELMGGTIGVESRPGKGTTFRFDVALQPCAPVPAETERPRVARIAPGQRPFRIAVVDDTPESRALLRKLLEAVGFDVREAENGARGLQLWREWRPDLVFMDMRMPVMDGREAIRRIRAEEAAEAGGGRTPILGLTASVLPHEAGALRAEGADDVLFKPFREETIFDAVGSLLGVRYEREARALPREPSGSPAPRAAPSTGRGRVLLADDDGISRALARELLRGAGYQVEEAANGLEALTLLEGPAGTFDAILLDVEMPRLGGIETVRRIRADARLRGLPVLAMTSHDDPEDISRLKAAGMDDHIAKPVDADVLVGTLARVLGGDQPPAIAPTTR